MAQAANTFDSFDADNANREDLGNIIYDISPTETPFVSAIGKTKATNKYHEWLQDSLAAPDPNNANVFGDDAPPAEALTPRVRLGNYVQLLDKVIIVSDDQRRSDPAGLQDELAYQLAKKMKEIKRDLEAILLGQTIGAQAPTAGSSTTAPKMGNVPHFITTHVDANGGVARAFAENQLKGMLQQVWEAGGEPSMVLLSAFQQSQAEGFSGSATKYIDSQDKEIVTAVDIYTTSFGSVTFVPTRFIAADRVYVIDPQYWAIAQFDALRTRPLARTGHAEKRMLSWYVTLEAREEAANGQIVDLTTT